MTEKRRDYLKSYREAHKEEQKRYRRDYYRIFEKNGMKKRVVSYNCENYNKDAE